MTQTTEEIAVNTEAIALKYSVSPATVRRWVDVGGCPHFQAEPGGALRFLHSEVAQWLKGKIKEAEES